MNSSASDWFSSNSHKKVSVPSIKSSSTSTSAVSVPPLPSVSAEVPASTLSSDGILGEKGEQLTVSDIKNRSKDIISNLVHNSLAKGTQRIYQLNFKLLKNFGLISGVKVDDFTFDFMFVCEFLLMRFQESRSLHSVKTARSSISFYWKLHSSQPCPTESPYVSMFVKGLCRKFAKAPNKAYPISVSYTHLTLPTIYSV